MNSRKTIWILNHHATDMALQHGGRHYYFAKYLIKQGYDVRIFCASFLHDSQESIDLQGSISEELVVDGIPFVFVKTRMYRSNGLSRVLGMFDYYFNVKKASKQYSKVDVIIGSSVHPLACVAAIHLSKLYHCKNIVEIRDLWPESIVEYGLASSKSLLIKLLYQAEKWIYTKANAVIFTMAGGKDYIIEKGWDSAHGGCVNLSKIYHINNGVDIDSFERNRIGNTIEDPDLADSASLKLVYTGSIRRANNLDLILDTAKLVKDLSIKFLIWGDGDQLGRLRQRIADEAIQNVVFKGKVEKQFVPNIVSQADVNFFVLEDSPLFRFGLSLNKSFEYLAAGKPLIIVGDASYSMVDEYHCGVHIRKTTAQDFAQAIEQITNLGKVAYDNMCKNARDAAKEYDFKVLANKLVAVIEESEYSES